MKSLYKNGQVKEDVKNGIKTVYFENGLIKAVGPFNKKMQGEWKFYKKSGLLWQIGNLKDDLKHGKWMRYNDDGTLQKSAYFKNGKEIK